MPENSRARGQIRPATALRTPIGESGSGPLDLSVIPRLEGDLAYTLVQEEDGSSYLEWVSLPLQQTIGVEPGVATSVLIEALCEPSDRERMSEWLESVCSGHAHPYEHRVRNQTGTVYWVNHLARATPLGDGSLRVDAELYDITENKLSQEALRESELRYRALAEHASDIIVELDQNQRVVYANPAMERILGFKPESILGMSLREQTEHGAYHPEDAPGMLERVTRNMAVGAPGHGRIRVRHRDRSYRWIEFHGSSFRTASGTSHRVVLGRDATELLRREEEQAEYAERLELEVKRRTEALEKANAELRRLQVRLIYAERLGAAEELAARMAHAVNNPLAALLGTIEMEIEQSGGTNPRLQSMRRIAHRIRAVLENTLTMVREGNLKLADEDPRALLEEVRSELAERALRCKSHIEIEIQPDLPKVNVDRTLLGAAIASVAENGLDAMKDSGGGPLHIRVVSDGEMLRFLVKDEGPGLPENAEKIFEPFFTTKPSGTGLGLPIAHGIIRGHGGRLTVQNHVQGGVLSTVTLPVGPQAPTLSST